MAPTLPEGSDTSDKLERVSVFLSDLADFIKASPTSYHAAAEVGRRLTQAGFTELFEHDTWSHSVGDFFVIRDGAVIAWRRPKQPKPGFAIVGAHTDSPALKLKPEPDTGHEGWQQVAMEVYGSPLLNSFLDRELGLAGRLVTADGKTHLVQTGPILRIPQLAIHLDRTANEALRLDKQKHLKPVLGLATQPVLSHLADCAGIEPDDIYGHDIFSFPTQEPATFGVNGEFFAAHRLDNLISVHAGVTALIAAESPSHTAVFAAFDHEEVGSRSRSGANGPFLADVLQRINADGQTEYPHSLCISSDVGHLTHPNYVEYHDPDHHPLPNQGPVVKVNASQHYATDAVGSAVWRKACEAADVPQQGFVSNNSVSCGSTIGPATATRLGITTVDVGVGVLSMHSQREMCGAEDPEYLARAFGGFWSL